MPFAPTKSYAEIVDDLLEAYGITGSVKKIWSDLFVVTASHEKLDKMLGEDYFTKKCICSTQDLMIRGCKCGGK